MLGRLIVVPTYYTTADDTWPLREYVFFQSYLEKSRRENHRRVVFFFVLSGCIPHQMCFYHRVGGSLGEGQRFGLCACGLLFHHSTVYDEWLECVRTYRGEVGRLCFACNGLKSTSGMAVAVAIATPPAAVGEVTFSTQQYSLGLCGVLCVFEASERSRAGREAEAPPHRCCL